MDLKTTTKNVAIALLVTLPTLFLFLFSASAPLMRGSEVFVISGLQLVFLAIYAGVRRRRRSRHDAQESPVQATETGE